MFAPPNAACITQSGNGLSAAIAQAGSDNRVGIYQHSARLARPISNSTFIQGKQGLSATIDFVELDFSGVPR